MLIGPSLTVRLLTHSLFPNLPPVHPVTKAGKYEHGGG